MTTLRGGFGMPCGFAGGLMKRGFFLKRDKVCTKNFGETLVIAAKLGRFISAKQKHDVGMYLVFGAQESD